MQNSDLWLKLKANQIYFDSDVGADVFKQAELGICLEEAWLEATVIVFSKKSLKNHINPTYLNFIQIN